MREEQGYKSICLHVLLIYGGKCIHLLCIQRLPYFPLVFSGLSLVSVRGIKDIGVATGVNKIASQN
jgi:hypothetical protein